MLALSVLASVDDMARLGGGRMSEEFRRALATRCKADCICGARRFVLKGKEDDGLIVNWFRCPEGRGARARRCIALVVCLVPKLAQVCVGSVAFSAAKMLGVVIDTIIISALVARWKLADCPEYGFENYRILKVKYKGDM